MSYNDLTMLMIVFCAANLICGFFKTGLLVFVQIIQKRMIQKEEAKRLAEGVLSDERITAAFDRIDKMKDSISENIEKMRELVGDDFDEIVSGDDDDDDESAVVDPKKLH